MPHGYVHRALYTLAALVAVGICARRPCCGSTGAAPGTRPMSRRAIWLTGWPAPSAARSTSTTCLAGRDRTVARAGRGLAGDADAASLPVRSFRLGRVPGHHPGAGQRRPGPLRLRLHRAAAYQLRRSRFLPGPSRCRRRGHVPQPPLPQPPARRRREPGGQPAAVQSRWQLRRRGRGHAAPGVFSRSLCGPVDRRARRHHRVPQRRRGAGARPVFHERPGRRPCHVAGLPAVPDPAGGRLCRHAVARRRASPLYSTVWKARPWWSPWRWPWTRCCSPGCAG